MIFFSFFSLGGGGGVGVCFTFYVTLLLFEKKTNIKISKVVLILLSHYVAFNVTTYSNFKLITSKVVVMYPA